jgi:antitoxin (DNA-binding transcriptional repressor) of toxin-antitoxin stability system
MQVNIHEAKSTLSKLLEKLSSGEESEIIIAKAGNPVGKLTPFKTSMKKRKLGTLRGKLIVPDSAWNEDDSLADEVDSNPLFPE